MSGIEGASASLAGSLDQKISAARDALACVDITIRTVSNANSGLAVAGPDLTRSLQQVRFTLQLELCCMSLQGYIDDHCASSPQCREQLSKSISLLRLQLQRPSAPPAPHFPATGSTSSPVAFPAFTLGGSSAAHLGANCVFPHTSLPAKPPPPPPSLNYHDYFIARPMCILFVQRAQIEAPLLLICAAAARLPQPRSQPPPHLDCTSFSLWPAQLQRAAIACAAAVSRRLATAPSSCRLRARTMQRWAACLQLHVLDGLVDKIQQTMAECRAAAAARIAGSSSYLHDIINATKHKDVALVADHLLVNPGLVNAMDICGTPLHWAAMQGSIRICELLLQSGADVNASSGKGNSKGYSPLHNCITRENTNLYFRIDFLSVCRLLVESKADLTVLDHYGYTPLRRAICCDQRDIAEYLRSVGAKEGPEPHRWE